MNSARKMGRGAPVAIETAGSRGVIYQDEVDRAQLTIDLPHHKIHEGELWECSVMEEALDDDATLILATDGVIGLRANFTFDGSLNGDAILELIRNPTVSLGSDVPVYSMNFNYPDPVMVCKKDPTLVGGTVVATVALPGGQKKDAGAASGSSREGLEWVCRPDRAYAVRLTNKAGGAKMAGVIINFYAS
jgi:hypothetical protein